VKKIHETDVIVFAAPVYFGGVSGQMEILSKVVFEIKRAYSQKEFLNQ
jgi:multimeric flavodoxin WrbA